jgi:uncharacterized protein YcbK (DUF882 family)
VSDDQIKEPPTGSTLKERLSYWRGVRDGALNRVKRLRQSLEEASEDALQARDKVSTLKKRVARLKKEATTGRPSEHFSYAEFNTKDGTPVPPMAYDGLDHLCTTYLEPLRAKFGPVSITSGYRHTAYNRQVGGEPNSVHIYDQPGRTGQAVAADITCASGSPAEWGAFLDKLGAGGVGIYPGSGFVHVDNRQRMGWGRGRWWG